VAIDHAKSGKYCIKPQAKPVAADAVMLRHHQAFSKLKQGFDGLVRKPHQNKAGQANIAWPAFSS